MAGGSTVQPLYIKCVNAFLEYETLKIVHISNKIVGVVNRIIQCAVIVYIAVYAIWYQRGYQDFGEATSATTTKLKGIASTNYSQLNISVHGGVDGIRIWDVADYVVPPEENDAFFVTTNIIITPGQTQGTCPEDANVVGSQCSVDSDCPRGLPFSNGNGIRTGKCVPSAVDAATKTCEIYAWCPVEVDRLLVPGQALLEDSKTFTVLIKNYVEFPKFKVKRRNIMDSQNGSYLQSCLYDKNSKVNRTCPIFSIETITLEAGVQNYTDIALYGGVIVINIVWDCNFDRSADECLPEYSFSRLDLQTAQIAKGSNFRYAAFYEKNDTLQRDLFKAYGIRFIVKVTGKAGKFSIVPLLLNIGSGIGLLAIASVVCDMIVLYVMKKRDLYRTSKYQYVDVNDDQTSIARQNLFETDDEGDSGTQVKRRMTPNRADPPYDRLDNDDAMIDS